MSSLSSVKTLVEAQTTPGVLYMRMPVTEFGSELCFHVILLSLMCCSYGLWQIQSDSGSRLQLYKGMPGQMAERGQATESRRS